MLSNFFTSMDIQTIMFLVSIAILTQACLIAVQSMLVREYHGVRTAALAYLGISLGLLFASVRGIFSDLLTIILANYIQIISLALLYVAICRFILVRYNKFIIALAVLPIILLFPYFTFVNYNLSARILLVDFGGVLLLGMMTFRLSQVRKKAYRFTAMLLTAAFGSFAVILIVRSLTVIISPPSSIFDSGLSQFFFAIALFVTSYLWSSVFSLMVSQRLQGDLNELATVDSLTRVTNRRGMMRILEAEFARKMRTQSDFSILLIDVDHFKSINDRYGHMMGDEVLHSIAQFMKTTIRAQDFIARWGGEEFLVLLPATSPREALEIGERLRETIAQQQFTHDGINISLTVSVGIGDSIRCADLDRIYKYADIALYKAKQTRNAVAWNEWSLN